MAKRDKKKGAEVSSQASSDEGFHNPFAAALSGLERAPVAPPADEAPSAAATGVVARRAVVRLEKKGRRGKQVTVVSHLEGLGREALAQWCAELRQSMGCGGVVEDDTVVLQGDHRQRVAAWLEQRGVKRVSVS